MTASGMFIGHRTAKLLRTLGLYCLMMVPFAFTLSSTDLKKPRGMKVLVCRGQ